MTAAYYVPDARRRWPAPLICATATIVMALSIVGSPGCARSAAPADTGNLEAEALIPAPPAPPATDGQPDASPPEILNSLPTKTLPSGPVRARSTPDDVVVVSRPAPPVATPEPPPIKIPVPTLDPPPIAPLVPIVPIPQTQVIPPPAPPRPYTGPTSGELKCNNTRVVQNGEVVFAGLPAGELRLTYDAETWEVRARADANNTQRLILRNRRPGTQRRCTVAWQLLP